MQYLSKKVAYLKGLAEGMKISESTNEGRLLVNIIEVLGELAEAVEDIEDTQVQLSEQVENIDDDLALLESDVYGDDGYYDDDDFDDMPYYEIECPNCHQVVFLDEEMLDDEDDDLVCPNCKEPIEIEFDCDYDCDCDCDCEHHDS